MDYDKIVIHSEVAVIGGFISLVVTVKEVNVSKSVIVPEIIAQATNVFSADVLEDDTYDNLEAETLATALWRALNGSGIKISDPLKELVKGYLPDCSRYGEEWQLKEAPVEGLPEETKVHPDLKGRWDPDEAERKRVTGRHPPIPCTGDLQCEGCNPPFGKVQPPEAAAPSDAPRVPVERPLNMYGAEVDDE